MARVLLPDWAGMAPEAMLPGAWLSSLPWDGGHGGHGQHAAWCLGASFPWAHLDSLLALMEAVQGADQQALLCGGRNHLRGAHRWK